MGRFRDWLRDLVVPKFDLYLLPPSESVFDRLNVFLKRMHETGVAAPHEIAGCTPGEIATLESTYSITLPATYSWYLETMGHKSGRLFTHDHMAAFYNNVLTLTANYREDAKEFPDKTVDLPPDALIIAGRLGEQFEFIRCNNELDSPVWYFNEWDNKIIESRTSVIYWLYSFCDAAQRAIESGYFKEFPNGATP